MRLWLVSWGWLTGGRLALLSLRLRFPLHLYHVTPTVSPYRRVFDQPQMSTLEVVIWVFIKCTCQHREGRPPAPGRWIQTTDHLSLNLVKAGHEIYELDPRLSNMLTNIKRLKSQQNRASCLESGAAWANQASVWLSERDRRKQSKKHALSGAGAGRQRWYDQNQATAKCHMRCWQTSRHQSWSLFEYGGTVTARRRIRASPRRPGSSVLMDCCSLRKQNVLRVSPAKLSAFTFDSRSEKSATRQIPSRNVRGGQSVCPSTTLSESTAITQTQAQSQVSGGDVAKLQLKERSGAAVPPCWCVLSLVCREDDDQECACVRVCVMAAHQCVFCMSNPPTPRQDCIDSLMEHSGIPSGRRSFRPSSAPPGSDILWKTILHFVL